MSHYSKNNMAKSSTSFKEGHVGYKGMLGKKHSQDTKELWSKTRKGRIPWNKGRVGVQNHSPETRLKMSNSRKGAKSHLWKGGITPINQQIRTSKKYKDWRIAVFERDDYTCQECGSRGVTLHADHIKPFAYYPELRLVIENGRTLCVPCHKKTDSYANKAKTNYQTMFNKK